MHDVVSHHVDFFKPTIGKLRLSGQFTKCDVMSKEPPQHVSIGQRMEAIRKGFSNMNQKEWADLHGFSTSQYNNWIKGHRRPTVDAALRLASQYGLSLDFIYLGRMDGLSETARNTLFSTPPSDNTIVSSE